MQTINFPQSIYRKTCLFAASYLLKSVLFAWETSHTSFVNCLLYKPSNLIGRIQYRWATPKSLVTQGQVTATTESNKTQWTYCGQASPDSDIVLVQHWLRWRLAVWRHQDTICTGVDLSSMRDRAIHPKIISVIMKVINTTWLTTTVKIKTIVKKMIERLGVAVT